MRANMHPCCFTILVNGPTLLIVQHIGHHDLIENLFMNSRVDDRRHDFDTTIEITRHQISRGNIDPRFRAWQSMPIAEGIDAGMFQKATDNRLHPNIVRQTFDTGPQTTNATHNQIDLNTGLAGLIQGIDDHAIDQGIAFEPDGGRPTGLGIVNFNPDMIENAGFQGQW